MAYAIVVPVDSAAARLIRSLQPPLRTAFWKHIRNMEPAKDSHRIVGIAAPGAQAYRFKIQVEDQTAHFTVVFRFADSADENMLLVAAIDVRMI